MTTNNTQLPAPGASLGDALLVVDTGLTNTSGKAILAQASQAALLNQSQNVPTPVGTGLTPSATLVAKNDAGNIFGFHVMNRNAAARYIFIVDKATAVAGGDTPLGCPITVPAGSQIELGAEIFTLSGWHCATGISIGVSTSNTAFVAGTAADHDILAAIV